MVISVIVDNKGNCRKWWIKWWPCVVMQELGFSERELN